MGHTKYSKKKCKTFNITHRYQNMLDEVKVVLRNLYNKLFRRSLSSVMATLTLKKQKTRSLGEGMGEHCLGSAPRGKYY